MKFKKNPILKKYLGQLIDIYIDARNISGGYADTQSVKMVVLMEILNKYILEDKRFNVKEHILDDDKELQKKMRKVIKDTFPNDAEIRSALYENLSGINRTPFKKLINRLCQEIALNISGPDIDLFVSSRNSLIHSGLYYYETATPNKKIKIPPLSGFFEEYLFIINFIDKIILRLFNYSGDYYNVQKNGYDKI